MLGMTNGNLKFVILFLFLVLSEKGIKYLFHSSLWPIHIEKCSFDNSKYISSEGIEGEKTELN